MNNGKKNFEILTKMVQDGIKINEKKYAETLLKGKINLKCKNEKQKQFARLIDQNQIILCKGPAGVGKSYISVVKALELLKNPKNTYEKLIIITPIVESDDQIGYLKGDLDQKISPYLYSTYYLIDKIIGEENRKKLVELGIIMPMVTSFLRGVNIDNSIVIFEEAQNSTKKGMKTFLTRLGFNSKFIISGDIEQIDRFKNEDDSGFKDILEKLKGINDVGIMDTFDKNDVVRNPLISEILDRY